MTTYMSATLGFAPLPGLAYPHTASLSLHQGLRSAVSPFVTESPKFDDITLKFVIIGVNCHPNLNNFSGYARLPEVLHLY
jgi:hypothetical protein